jgi:tetratricopeptide (TPR) repeat protein
MFSKGWVPQKFDTISTLYAGIAAEKAKKRDDAAAFYSQVADMKLSDSKYEDIYKWLVGYYSDDKADEATAMKYVNLGKQVYPADSVWKDMELSVYETKLDAARKKGNKDSLFAQYEHILANVPNNHLFVYNYGVELYNYAIDTTSGKRPENSDALIAKAKEELNKAIQIKPDYAQAYLLLGQIAYNDAVDFKATTKNIKGQKPEDIKKRADIRVAAAKKFDDAIPYFEKVDQLLGSMGKLKQDERRSLKDSYDLLITIYEQKNQKDKSDMYTKKFNDVDKVH